MTLREIVDDFAKCIKLVDARSPRAVSTRTKRPFRPGIGPHSETQVVELVTAEMMERFPTRHAGKISINVPYPDMPRQRCDFCVGSDERWEWAVEVKMLRILGDNGKPNDNILMHILSPYPKHRSAVTDCKKLSGSRLGNRKAVLIYGYEAEDYPLALAIKAFETIASSCVELSPRVAAEFKGLIHPVHRDGMVYGWEIAPRGAAI